MNMKKITMALGLIGLLCLFASTKAEAANPDTMNITVTVATALSVDITGDPYEFGTIAASASTGSTRAITVTNDTGGRTEDFTINAANSTNWTLGASPGAETFALFAMLNSVQPLDADFHATNDDLTAAPQDMDATLFTGDQTGDDVVDTGSRSLWFKLQTPTSTAFQTEQTIVVTVTAADASTF